MNSSTVLTVWDDEKLVGLTRVLDDTEMLAQIHYVLERTGINQADISKLENGTRNLNVTLIEKLCSLFGCTEDYLLGREDAYLPLNFAFRSNKIQAEDLESIAAVNKIVMNIRYMNEKMGD